ncbi:hypothetical protein F2P81_002197 [Scophthalmus maximus]|uniref:Uncharacterized protein n=1 Tax=Scophthalmus maximus TaxID=52904 RepID=A0A6A4TMS5_SCOMX|nr:hypothetical protein F2P81_002197 [Scophthalmus maximus]
MEHPGRCSVGPSGRVVSGEAPGGATGRWSAVALSALGSAVTVAAVGCLCAFIYPILTAGCICCAFSWTLTYLDSYQPGTLVPTLAHLRDVSGHGFLMDYGVVVLNGIMAMLTVIWSLT